MRARKLGNAWGGRFGCCWDHRIRNGRPRYSREGCECGRAGWMLLVRPQLAECAIEPGRMMLGQQKRALDGAADAQEEQPAKYRKPSDDAKPHGDGAAESGNGWSETLVSRPTVSAAGSGRRPVEAVGAGDGHPRGELVEGSKNGRRSEPVGPGDGSAFLSDLSGAGSGDSGSALLDTKFATPVSHAGRDELGDGGRKERGGSGSGSGSAAGAARSGRGSGAPGSSGHRNSRSRQGSEEVEADQAVCRETVEKELEVDQAVFLETVKKELEAKRSKRLRPLPVVVAGKVVDLYNFNVKVRELGGYCKVSADSLWGNVAEELGLDRVCGPAVKLVYFKYLRKLESRKSAAPGARIGPALSQHLAVAVPGGELSNGKREAKAVEQSGDSESSKEEAEEGGAKGEAGGLREQRPWLPDVREGNPAWSASGSLSRSGSEGAGILFADGANEEGDGRGAQGQRRFDTLAHMLQWIRRMAVDPNDPLKGQGEAGSGQDAEWVRECLATAQRVRGFLWRNRDEPKARNGGGDGFHGQNKQTSRGYYEEPAQPDMQALDKLRSTKERIIHYGLQPPQSSQRPASSTLGHHNNNRRSCSPPPVFYIGSGHDRKDVKIGHLHQAEVPEWNPRSIPPIVSAAEGSLVEGYACTEEGEDDVRRWFGTRVWPRLGFDSVVNKYRVGAGRSEICSCEEVESIECVRLHVHEEKQKLKAELGSAFDDWKFQDMGESVADQWTNEEQHAFTALVKMNPAILGKNFWDQLPVAFPNRSMKELVSYYFNVFVLRRRAIQNRLLEEKLDSDDDDKELPVTDSDYTDESESGEDDDEEVEDTTGEDDAENTTGSPVLKGNSPRHPHFTELEASLNYSTSKIEAEGLDAVLGLPPTVVSRLDDAESQMLRLGQRNLRETAHLGGDWEHELHGSEKHHVEGVTAIADDALQQVQGWEVLHWDETDHDFAKVNSKQEENVPKDGSLPIQTLRGCKHVEGSAQVPPIPCKSERNDV